MVLMCFVSPLDITLGVSVGSSYLGPTESLHIPALINQMGFTSNDMIQDQVLCYQLTGEGESQLATTERASLLHLEDSPAIHS